VNKLVAASRRKPYEKATPGRAEMVQALAFDCANVFDEGMRALGKAEEAWLDLSQQNLVAFHLWQQAFWLMPGLFLLGALQRAAAACLEMQVSTARLLFEETKINSALCVQMVSDAAGIGAAALTPSEGQMGQAEMARRAAA
jgi:hypothetical protein